MKRIRKFAARVTQPKSERDKARLAKLGDEEVIPDSVSGDDVPHPNRDDRKGRRRRRSRSRCASRHSIVLGRDGYPSPPPHCSALNDDKDKLEDGCDSSGSQASFSDSDWLNVTLPYPFAIGTITGNFTPSEVGVQVVGLSHPLEPVAAPRGFNVPSEGLPCSTLPNRDLDTLSMESLLEGRTTSEDEMLATMLYDPSFKAKYSKYERLINEYWQVRDFRGNSRLENWVSIQIEEAEKIQATQKKEREAAQRLKYAEDGFH